MPYRPKDIYRGRRKYRVPLTIALFLLALLVVGAVAMFYILQQFLVYDQTGVRLELPFMQQGEASEEPAEAAPTPAFVPVDVQIIYEDPDFSEVDLGGWETLSPTRAKFVPFSDATSEQRLSAAIAAVGEEYDGVVLELKGRSGQLAWPSASEMAVNYGASGSMDYTETVAQLHERGLTAGVQISCLADKLLVERNWPAALRNKAGEPYRDGSGTGWLDPYNRSVRAYLSELMAELAAMGFDEILLADLYHPVSDNAELGENGELLSTGFLYSTTLRTPENPVNAICQMARRLVEELPEEIEVGASGEMRAAPVVSAVIDEASLLSGNAVRTGQDIGVFWRIFARLYCPCENWNAMTDLENAAETLNGGDIGARFVPVCEYFPEDLQSWLILPTK